MATVYLARDERHGREVAIKVFQVGPGDEDGAARFLNEIQVAARLAHPNILPVHDSGHAEGFSYYVMPFVPGESLRERLEREGALPVADALAIAGQIANALSYAHSNGVIHRDIKPENILFLAGQAVVADFGIARAISAGGWSRRMLGGDRIGTPAYMSPEQAVGGSRVDGRSDVYSLGCVVYEMFTGDPPFRGDTPEDLVVKHLQEEPEPLQIRRAALPPEVQPLVAQALAKNPADRYPTAQQFADAISRVQVGQLTTPVGTPAVRRPGTARGIGAVRWVLPAAAIAAVIYAAVGSVAAQGGFGVPPVDPARLAIAPFLHHHGAAPMLLTGEQCARIIREAFSRWDDVSLVDSRWMDDRLSRLPEEPALDDLLKVARQANAGRLVSGEVWPFRDSLRIRGVLYDTRRGGRIIRERTISISASMEQLEARFQELADSLLLDRPQTGVAAGGALGTRLIVAWQAYDSAHAALARWELDAAVAGFRLALERDPGYGLAHLWLAQTQSWMGRPTESWRDHAIAGLGAQPPLHTRDREWAMALAAMAEGRFPEACERYDAMIRRDTLDFRGWYGRAECRSRDHVVQADPKSPSGFRFRSSYQAAINDYHKALTLVPSTHMAFRGGSFDRLSRLYFAEGNIFRPGSRADAAAADFAAFPAIDADTMVFVPWPLEQVITVSPGASGGAQPEAVRRNQRRLAELTGEWARTFPSSVPAIEAEGLALELVGEFGTTVGASDSAVHRIQQARRLTSDNADQIRLGSVELRMLLKQERFHAAVTLADSLLRTNPAPTVSTAPYLAAAAALTGRAALAARLNRLSARDHVVWTIDGAVLNVPLPLRETALALEAFAAVGAPVDSLDGLYRLAQRQLNGYLAPDRRELADAALLDQTRALLYLATPVTASRNRAPLSYLLRLQNAARRGESAEARAIFGHLARIRVGRRPGGQAVEVALAEALVELTLNDTAAALVRLDGYLSGLSSAGLDLTERPVASGSLVRLMALRARLAVATGDRALARKWAGDVVTLWGRADPGLGPVLEEMRAIATRPS
jgi:tetratricopeptide (TPR) repeat protein